MRNTIASLLQVLGAGGVIAAGWMTSAAAGVFATALVVGTAGVLMDNP